MNKLTYSESKCNSYIYFSLYADNFDIEDVTQQLNLKPTSVRQKGEPVPKLTSWKFQIDVGNDIDLKAPLSKLIDTFEAKTTVINSLKQIYGLETRLQFVIHIDVDPEASTPFFPLDKRAISFLSITETIVDFDIYKSDPKEIALRKTKDT